jgi:hypothetical protein
MTSTLLDLNAVPDEFVSAVEMLAAARNEVRRLQDESNNALGEFKTRVREAVAFQDRDLTDDDDAEAFLDYLGLEPLVRDFQVVVPMTVTFLVKAKNAADAKDKARYDCLLSDNDDYEADWWGAEVTTV